jgi:cytochrome b involved in lipid metabolism
MYDLTEFVAQHPGGKSWLELTKGQDITALFHTHHLEIDKVTPILEKYYVGECPTPRPSRFEFGHHFEAIRKRILSKFTVK